MLQSSNSEKNLAIPLKNCFLDPICTEKGSSWATPKVEKTFFGRNNKKRWSAFRKFLFYQNIICFDWVMNLFLSWVTFSVKKVSFPAKTAVLIVLQFFLWIPPRVSGLWALLFWKRVDIIAYYRRFLHITSFIGMLQALFLQEFKVHRFMDVCAKFLY